MAVKKIHIKNHKGKRSTVSLHTTLYKMLVIALGQQPETNAGAKAVNEWIQKETVQDKGRIWSGSWEIQHMAIIKIADKKYVDEFWDVELNESD